MVDATVTGSNTGIFDKPKLPLKRVLWLVVLPHITLIIIKWFPGYITVIQGIKHELNKYVYFRYLWISECHNIGCHWEPQANQNIYNNNIYLSVSPSTAKMHSSLIKEYSNDVVNDDTIYFGCKEVWKALTSVSIAHDFFYRTKMQKKGWNTREKWMP